MYVHALLFFSYYSISRMWLKLWGKKNRTGLHLIAKPSCEYTGLRDDHIPIVSIQMTRVSKSAQENGRGGYQKPFNTEAFEDTQAHWWLFEVEGVGKAVQILPVAGGKVMNI